MHPQPLLRGLSFRDRGRVSLHGHLSTSRLLYVAGTHKGEQGSASHGPSWPTVMHHLHCRDCAVHTHSQDPAQPIPTPSYIFQSRASAQGHGSTIGMAFLVGT